MRWTPAAASFAFAAFLAGPIAAQTAVPAPPPAPAAAPAPPQSLLKEGVVATVNDQIISTYDVRQRLMLLIAMSGVKVDEQNLPELEQEALRGLVDERLQSTQLKQYGVKVEDSEVEDEITNIAKQNTMSKAQLLDGLHRAGVEPQTLREEMRARIGWQELVSGRFRDHARVGDDEVKQTLARISAAAEKPQFLVGEIYIDAARVGGMDEAVNGANQLVDQLVKGAPFQAVARQFSAAPTAANGGDAGWLISGEMTPEVQNALEHMHPGQLSKPIPTRDGVWIVYLREQRAGGGEAVVDLKQAAIKLGADAPAAQVEAASQKLAALAPKLSCDSIAKVNADGVIGSDLGQSNVKDLAPEFQQTVAALKPGQVSAPIRTSVGVHVIAVCDRHLVGSEIPTREQVENKLFASQIGMFERRWMRDLRSSATIEMRN